MKHTTFTCDLCKTACEPGAVYGIITHSGGGVEYRPASKTNAHLCRVCTESIARQENASPPLSPPDQA